MVHCHCTMSMCTVPVHCPCTLSMLSLTTVTVHGTLYSGTVRCHCHCTLPLHTVTIHCHRTLSLYTVQCTLYSVHCTPHGLIECIPTHSTSATTPKSLY